MLNKMSNSYQLDQSISLFDGICHLFKEALAIRRIFSLVDMITEAKFSNSPNDFEIRLFG